MNDNLPKINMETLVQYLVEVISERCPNIWT